jgi:hypothetical protein
MANEETDSKQPDVPDKEPGALVGVEWTRKGTVSLKDDEKKCIKDLLTKLFSRDSPPRREEIIRVWERRLFDRGFQHILPLRNGGWALPAQGTGYGYGEEGSKSNFETNIYASYGQIITAALTREVPNVRFKAVRPHDDAGITAAQSAESLKIKITRTNAMLALLEDTCRFLWTDGRVIFETCYMKDAARFGFAPEPEEVVPENEEKANEADESESDHADESAGGAEENVGADEENATSGADEHSEESGERAGESEEHEEEEHESRADEESLEKEPNGQEVICVGGALEWKLPIRANNLRSCGYAIRSQEIDQYCAKAKYPEAADDIKPSKGGPGGDDLDRLARLNVEQGMMDSYNTADSEANTVTEVKAWIRPWQLLELADEHRDSIVEKFPAGMQVVFCGDTFCEARDESIEDHLTLLHALPGDGMHRPGLGDWLLPIQKVLNNWLELANDYFVRGVPAKFMDNEMFDVEAIREQVNLVGETHPFQREPGVTMDQVIWEETAPQFPEQLMSFIQDFKGETPQLLCGAFPALFGGDTGSNDTMGGIQLQRDQALGRLGLTWRRLKEAIASVMMQAVQCLAKNHDHPIFVTDKVSVTVEMADLKGDMYAYPEVDENFPDTPTQKQNRIVQVITEAAQNPMLGQIVDDPDNLEMVRDAVGLENFVIKALESRDKQLGEIEIMLESGPIPNPQIQQLKQQIMKLTQQAAMETQDPAAVQAAGAQVQQLTQAMQALPPLVSSEPIDVECDDNEIEAATALRFINSPRGRAMKNGSEDERQSFANIRLHYLEHDKADKAKKAAAAPQPIQKPPSVSANVKDMTPDEAAQALAQAGIKSDPQNIATARATSEAAKHPKEAVPVVQ